MTPVPQPHCEHECVCSRYQYKSTVAFHDGTRCLANHEGCNPCEHDTRSHPHTSNTASQKANADVIFELDGILSDMPTDEEIQQKHDTAIRKEVLDALGIRLNSWISAMEILDSKHPSPLRKGIIMAYRDVEEWERQMRKSPRGEP